MTSPPASTQAREAVVARQAQHGRQARELPPVGQLLVVGAVAAATAGVMSAVAAQRHSVLFALLLLAQVGFVAGWAYLLDLPDLVGAIAIPGGAAAASDGILLSAHHVSLTDLATIVALSFLLALIWQVANRRRRRVTEFLTSTSAAAALAVAGAGYLMMRAGLNGEQSASAGGQAATAALLGVAVALGVARLVDAVWSRPRLSAAGERGLPGLVLGLAAVVGAGMLYDPSALTSGDVTVIALVAGAAAALTDVAVAAGLATIDADRPGDGGSPYRPAPWPARLAVVAVLPVLVAAPPAYVAARLVLT